MSHTPLSLSQCTASATQAEQVVYRPPSQLWLNRPAYIDGASNPPRFYATEEEIEAELATAARHGYFPNTPAENTFAAPSPAQQPQNVDPVLDDHQPMKPVEDDEDVQEITPLEAAGYLVSVTAVHTPPPAPGSKPSNKSPKKTHLTISGHIRIAGNVDRVEFVTECFKIHGLDKVYRAGDISGPGFKIWYSGSNGGKAHATLIETEQQFVIIRTALLRKLEKKPDMAIMVELDLDTMSGFLVNGMANFVHQAVASASGNGTMVPRVEHFSKQTQAEGTHVFKLKAEHSCAIHLGEHGQPGHCYINPTGEHLLLTHYRLKVWAAAIEAHNATYQTPPNCAAFDGAHDGHAPISRSRGRLGPHPSTGAPSAPANDAIALIVAAMLPMITQNLSSLQKRQRSPSPTPSGRDRKRQKIFTTSPLPSSSLEEIQLCLQDFLAAKNIDLVQSAEKFHALDLTPDILPRVPVSRLCELTGAVEGHCWKLQKWCEEWSTDHDAKRAL